MPFGEVVTNKTKRDYANLWARFIAYVLNNKDRSPADRRFELTPEHVAAINAYTLAIADAPAPLYTPATHSQRVDALLTLSYALIAHRLPAARQSVHPLVAFTILTNIQTGLIFADPIRASPMIASIKYMERAIVLSDAIRESQDPRNTAASLFDSVQGRRQWIMEGQNTMFAWICQMAHLTAYYVYESDRMPRFVWSRDGGKSWWFDGDRIMHEQFVGMFKIQLLNCQREFTDLWTTGWGLPLQWMTSRTLWRDDTSEKATNYCFIDDPANVELHQLYTQCLKHVSNKGRLCRMVTGQICWHETQIREVFERSREFVKTLMCTAHMLGGQPPRGTEIKETLILNTPGRTRNLYLLNERVTNVGFLNKTTFILKRDKPIPRAYPLLLTLIIINYLAILRKLELEYLINHPGYSATDVEATRTHLFCVAGYQLHTDSLSARIMIVTAECLGLNRGWGTAALRQAMVYFGKYHVRVATDADGQILLDFQSGHCGSISEASYAVEAGRLASGLDPIKLQAFMELSFAHHTIMGVDKLTLMESQVCELLCEILHLLIAILRFLRHSLHLLRTQRFW